MYEIIEVRYTGSYIVGSNTLQAVLGTFVATTASDLPSQNADCHIICGSNGLDISTGDKYIWDGYAWIKQPNASISFPDMYSKTETDTLLSAKADKADLVNLINQGQKNKMKLTGSDVTGYGIACTFDKINGTIHLDGINADKKCTGSFNIQASDSRTLGLVAGETYNFSCDGYETSNDDIGLYVYTSGASPVTQFDCFANRIEEWNPAWEQASGFRLFIRQGTVVDDVTLKPMICTQRDYLISNTFEPYTPTLHELYALIKSYHP